MKLSILILALLLTLASQAQTFKGNIQIKGNATTKGVSSFIAYSGVDVIQPPSVPNLGGLTNNYATVYDSTLPPLAPIWRCTDANSMPDHANFTMSAGLGGSGDAAQMFNANATALHVNDQGGGNRIMLMDPANHLCGGSAHQVITANKSLDNPGSSGTSYGFGDGSWDWTNPYVWYADGGTTDVTSATQIVKYVFTDLTSTGGTFHYNSGGAGPVADLLYALPQGANAPAYATNTSYVPGNYVSYTFSEPDWQASTAYSTLGTIILPLTNNPLGCAFKLTVAGTSAAGGSEPTWSNTGTCKPASNGQITDNTAKWRNLGGGPTFVYQLTTALTGGQSGSSTPTFTPDLASTVSDHGGVWTNVGLSIPPAWDSFAGVSQDSTRFCETLSTNQYGYVGAGAGNYVNANGGQGTAIFAACYNVTDNSYHLFNTLTNWISHTTCTGGTGDYKCTSGTLALIPDGVASTGYCPYFTHNMKGSSMMDYPIIAAQAQIPSGCSPVGPMVWKPFAAFNASTSVQALAPNVNNHWAMGNSHVLNVGQNSIYGFSTGAYTQWTDLTNSATWATPPITWQPACGSAPLPPCQLSNAYDSHLSLANNPGLSDTSCAGGSVFNISTGFQPQSFVPWSDEEVCVTVTPNWAAAGPVDPAAKVYRFTHNFNFGNSATFDAQYSISQLSQATVNGQFLAWTSDWEGTLGSTAGDATATAGPTWIAGYVFPTGSTVCPASGFTGTMTRQDCFSITNAGSVASGPTAPTWASCSPSCTDGNGITYTDLGIKSNARADIFIVGMK